jgi:putative ABC transport system permease protein
MHVSTHLFSLLGVSPALGRGLLPGEDETGRHRVVLIADGLWRRRFGADPGVVGRDIRVNGEPYAVVGVMPPGFRFAPFWQTQAELWAPLVLEDRWASRGGRSLRVFGRLRDGVPLETARAEMTALTARLAHAYPDTNTGITTTVTPLTEMAVGAVRPTLIALLGMALLVLAIAVANVSTLMLVRALARQHELAIRTALGAGLRRLLGLFFGEGLLLGLAGAAAGALLAATALRGLAALMPPDALPGGGPVGVGPVVFAGALGIAIVAATTATIVPMAVATRPDLARAMIDAVRGATPARRHRRARAILVGLEVSMALVLLTGAALLGRTLINLRQIDTGLDPHGLVTMSVSLDGTDRAEGSRRTRYFRQLQERLTAQPGIAMASAINHLPLAGDLWRLGYRPEGRPEARPGDEDRAAYRVVLPGYFRTVGQRLVRGRDFASSDHESAVPVAIVNETLARRQWPDGTALGRRLVFPGPQGDARPVTVVGVVGDARQLELAEPPIDEIYLPLAQRAAGDPSRGAMTVVARASGEETAALSSLRAAAWEIDRQAAVYEVQSMSEVLSREIWREAFAARLVAAFALVALMLAAVGIHGVVAYAVAGRMREFGIRLALGASPAGLGFLAFGDAFAPLLVGLAGGTVLAVAFGGMLQTLLYGVSGHDPWAVAAAAAVLGVTGIAAAWRPARRAARLDPIVVLRQS